MSKRMGNQSVIRLTLPADLRFRDVAVRAVAEACRLVSPSRYAHGSHPRVHSPSSTQTIDLSDRFAAEVVSAVSEIFNNIAIHGYGGEGSGDVTLEMTIRGDRLVIVISDQGSAFDPSRVPLPELESLPEGGMGIHIAKACLDELNYTPGPPNVWRLTKYTAGSGRRPRRISSPT
ncbi:MAG TPA: ATP-binding protein [Candidatus Acidoferrum sp.]|nr:ATP-binding protein [Candidatus Acidoferrum sp.]